MDVSPNRLEVFGVSELGTGCGAEGHQERLHVAGRLTSMLCLACQRRELSLCPVRGALKGRVESFLYRRLGIVSGL